VEALEAKEDNFKTKYMSKEMRRMIFKLMLLSEIKEKKRYPYELIELMADSKKAKFIGSKRSEIKNDIYNIIRGLEKSGYIKLVNSSKNAQDKKYYQITPQGRNALMKSKRLMLKYMRELVKLIR
jgi:DNA-binding PadR family transcriptional regulator